MFIRILLVLAFLVSMVPHVSLLRAQEDELIEIEVDDTEESSEEEIEEKEEPVKKELKKMDLGLEFSKFDFQFYGSMFYNSMVNQNKQTNNNEYNNFHIEKVRTDTIMGLRFLNKSDISGFVEFDFKSDYSYYDFIFYRASLDFNRKIYKFKFFYRERFYNFDDGLRLLDDEYFAYDQPIKFYKIPVQKTALFGKFYYGTYFEYDHYFKNRLAITAPYQSDQDKNYMIFDQMEYSLSIININANAIFIDQNFSLPEVNDSNWAEYKGTWYEFNTNTFHDPLVDDYQVKATGEINIRPVDRFVVWGEAGIDNKYGGYYGESSQKTTDSGNIPYQMILSSPNYKSFIMGGGAQIDLHFLLLEGDYKGYHYKINSFSFSSNIIERSIEPKYNEISARFQLFLGTVSSINEVALLKVNQETIDVSLDPYNFQNVELPYVIEQQKARSFNKITIGDLTLIPEGEFRNYAIISNNSLQTIEVNQGLMYPLTPELKLYMNVRYKQYHYKPNGLDEQKRTFLYAFTDISYYFKENIHIGLSYGLDPRLIYVPYGYGFECELNSQLDINSFDLDTITDAENPMSKNHYIVLRGMIHF